MDDKTLKIKFKKSTANLLRACADDEGVEPRELAERLLDEALRDMLRGLGKKKDTDSEVERLRKEAAEAGLPFDEYVKQLSKLGHELGAADAIREQYGIAKKDD